MTVYHTPTLPHPARRVNATNGSGGAGASGGGSLDALFDDRPHDADDCDTGADQRFDLRCVNCALRDEVAAADGQQVAGDAKDGGGKHVWPHSMVSICSRTISRMRSPVLIGSAGPDMPGR